MPVSKNIFDGNGTANGHSLVLARTAIENEQPEQIKVDTVSVAVLGNFDGASVALQKYILNEWVTLDDAKWTYARILKGVTIEVGTAIRLMISGAGENTHIKAAVLS